MILSIIIPVYNVEKYIRKTLQSIFSQDVNSNKFEVIVVNDGSPDRSVDIANEFASLYSNIIIINQENQGLSGARNTGLKAAKGNYVWFVDSDDWIEQNSLNRILNLLQTSSHDIFLFKIKEYNERNILIKERSFIDNDKLECVNGSEVIKRSIKNRVLFTPMQMHIIKRVFLLENNLFFKVGIYHEDVEFAPRLLFTCEDIVYVPWVSYCYLRRSSGNITSNYSSIDKRLKDLLHTINEHKQYSWKEKNGYNRRIIDLSAYRVLRTLWSYADLSAFKRLCDTPEWYKNKRYIRSIVWKNIYCDKSIKHVLGQIIFLISPILLKKINKSF